MMNKNRTASRHRGNLLFIVAAVVFGSLAISTSKASNTHFEDKQFKNKDYTVFQDTNKFKNLDSVKFRLQQEDAPAFGKETAIEDPVVLLDGKKISKKQMKSINPEHIKEISVYKGETAVKLYGEEARGGVILITKKTAED